MTAIFQKMKTVVVFFSLDANVPAYRGFLNGLNEQFSKTGYNSYHLIVEYMDLSRISDEEHIKGIIDLYNDKYENVEIDMLITFSPETYPILKKYGFKAMQHSPIINIDLESSIPESGVASSSTAEKVLHISIKPGFLKTLTTAIELFPDHKDVYIISGSSPTDHYFADLTLKAAQEFKESHIFRNCTGSTLDSTLAMSKTIPQNSIVFVTSYLEDVKKIPYSSTIVGRAISANCKAPLFTLSDDFINAGAIGGYVYSFVDVGKQTGIITMEVINGKPLNEITVDEDGFNKHMYDWEKLEKWNLVDSKVIPADSGFFNRDGNLFIEYRWYLIAGMVFLIGQASLIFFLIDLNKRHKAVARQRGENEQLYRELVREDRLSRMSELTASLSHELNQPLTAILYNAQAGKRFLETGKLDDKQVSEILDNIIEDDRRAGSLISSVRSLMKLEDREKEKVNLNSLIQETEKLFNSESIANHIHINLSLLNQSAFVFGDKIQLQQVLLNLLFNAEISMENNSLENKKIEIVQQLYDGYVTVSIRDSGPGFEDSIKETLFKPFVTSRAKGLGIGLAVSRSIIEAHQGTIWAENLPGGGAEFSFKLHLYDDEK